MFPFKRNKLFFFSMVIVAISVFSTLAFNQKRETKWLAPAQSIEVDAEKRTFSVLGENATQEELVLPLETETESDSQNHKETTLTKRNPAKEYSANIEMAEAGDARAMFRVSHALAGCSIDETPSESYIRSIELDSSLDSDFKQEFRSIINTCAPLFDLIKPQSKKELQLAWREAASREGDVFARLESFFFDPGKRQVQARTIEALLYDALGQSAYDPILEEVALRGVLKYHSRFLEKARESTYIDDGFDRGLNRSGWDYLHCSVSLDCELPEYHELLRKSMPEHEILQIAAKSDELQILIQDQKWDELGLDSQQWAVINE